MDSRESEGFAPLPSSKSRPSITRRGSNAISRILTNASGHSQRQRSRGHESDEEDVWDTKGVVEDWKTMPELQGLQDQESKDQAKGRKLSVTWNTLTLKGIKVDAAINENVESRFNILNAIREKKRKEPLRILIDNSHGCITPGEMLLVLGRPGAGCTTLLKMLANRRKGYKEVTGDIHWGSMDSKEAEKFRGQIVMNTEEELFFPTLTVGQTIDFATRMKIPALLPSKSPTPAGFQLETRKSLLKSMGITHTGETKIGNEFLGGVSGGERIRVSIIETFAARGSVMCWDNSSRGLDASTALEYTKAVRAITDIFGLASIGSLYQAGNGIYNLFDKVLVLDEGKQVYYGPLKQARSFMEELGFHCADRANVSDYLTGILVPSERKIRKGHENSFPRTAEDLRAAYQNSKIKAEMKKDYDYWQSEEARVCTEDFKMGVAHEKAKGLPKISPLTVSFTSQVKACITRQYQILWGDKATILIKQLSTLVQALISGSLFYNAPNNSAGLFVKPGAIFLALLFNSLLAMSEVADSFSGRPVLPKHKQFAFYHPAAFCVTQITADIPVILFQVSHFSLVLYFMVGLKLSVSAFFIFWLFLFVSSMAMTALFRAIGTALPTFDAASKVSGFTILTLIMYTGYMIPKPE